MPDPVDCDHGYGQNAAQAVFDGGASRQKPA